MGTTISHIVKHDFGQFNDWNASKAYCEKIYNFLRKEILQVNLIIYSDYKSCIFAP